MLKLNNGLWSDNTRRSNERNRRSYGQHSLKLIYIIKNNMVDIVQFILIIVIMVSIIKDDKKTECKHIWRYKNISNTYKSSYPDGFVLQRYNSETYICDRCLMIKTIQVPINDK